MKINSIGRTSFGLKFDSYMQDKLDEAKERLERIYRNPKELETSKKKLQSTLSDDYTLCLVPKDSDSWQYDLYLTSDKFNNYKEFLCKKVNKDKQMGFLFPEVLDQLTERIKKMKAGNFKYYGPTMFVKDEK